MHTHRFFPGLLTVILLFFLSGCSYHTYSYLSFEDVKGIKITQWKEDIDFLPFLADEKIPLEYELQRSRYTIKLFLTLSMDGRVYEIGLVDKNGHRYLEHRYVIEGNGQSRITSFSPLKKKDGRYVGTFLSERAKGYSHFFKGGPRRDQPHDPEDKNLRFSVFDEENQLIGIEVIPYKIKIGGTYYQLHGI